MVEGTAMRTIVTRTIGGKCGWWTCSRNGRSTCRNTACTTLETKTHCSLLLGRKLFGKRMSKQRRQEMLQCCSEREAARARAKVNVLGLVLVDHIASFSAEGGVSVPNNDRCDDEQENSVIDSDFIAIQIQRNWVLDFDIAYSPVLADSRSHLKGNYAKMEQHKRTYVRIAIKINLNMNNTVTLSFELPILFYDPNKAALILDTLTVDEKENTIVNFHMWLQEIVVIYKEYHHYIQIIRLNDHCILMETFILNFSYHIHLLKKILTTKILFCISLLSLKRIFILKILKMNNVEFVHFKNIKFKIKIKKQSGVKTKKTSNFFVSPTTKINQLLLLTKRIPFPS
ncbi:hypothetical protein RFI_21206 [Reticulomyxa filosa]|uniref:Uncharacterized protein n=1 Tax=Reticulomyxa filosa TaxID=46433 RepID=X6MSR1_RETFI|nr:hypothetical protein RFI_21206 [Reticulomyxa filosa]|eukprot:ETO16150.1 hypothetical protein RFI_21206 [Reticulomyxa filosa]